MRIRIPYTLLCACALMGASCTTRTTVKDDVNPKDGYTIKLVRPYARGTRFMLTGECKYHRQRTDFTIDGTPIPVVTPTDPVALGRATKTVSSDAHVIFKGVVTVLEVDEQGQIAECSIDVDVCTIKRDDGPKTVMIPQGSRVVITQREPRNKIRVDGERTTKDVKTVLRDLIRVSHRTSKLDMYYGSKKRRKIGESWSMDKKQFAAKNSQDLDPERIDGKVVLEKLVDHDSTTCMAVCINVSLTEPLSPVILPKGYSPVRSRLKATFTYHFPLDVTRPLSRVCDKTYSSHYGETESTEDNSRLGVQFDHNVETWSHHRYLETDEK